jgi:hypothetical protein
MRYGESKREFRHPRQLAGCFVIAAAVAAAAARYEGSGTRRAALLNLTRRHYRHLAHGALAGQQNANLFVIFLVVFLVALAVTYGVVRIASRARERGDGPYQAVKPKRRGGASAAASGYAPYSDPGYWYGGPQ